MVARNAAQYHCPYGLGVIAEQHHRELVPQKFTATAAAVMDRRRRQARSTASPSMCKHTMGALSLEFLQSLLVGRAQYPYARQITVIDDAMQLDPAMAAQEPRHVANDLLRDDLTGH